MKKTVEQRLAALEKRLAAIERPLRKAKKPWLLHAGWAKDDPIYDKAMKLGAAYRRSS
jgi:hypothetical protein